MRLGHSLVRKGTPVNSRPSGPPKRDAKRRRSSTRADPPAVGPSVSPSACPLAPDWPARLRYLMSVFSNPAEEARLKAAHRTKLDARSEIIEVEWHVASDDHSQQAPLPTSLWSAGVQRHIHTEFEVGKQRVHIDGTWAIAPNQGPGRCKEEWYIFIDNVLAGFGGRMACALGLNVTISPAVALLRDNWAIVIGVGSEPGQIALRRVSRSQKLRQPRKRCAVGRSANRRGQKKN